MKRLIIYVLFLTNIYAFDKVAFNVGAGAISLSSNDNILNIGYGNVGATIYYPWFNTELVSGLLIDMMVYQPSDPQAYDPTNTQTPHDLGIISTIGFNLGYLFDNYISIYGGLKYSNNQISGVTGEGFALSLNIEYEFNDEMGIGLAYKEGDLNMYLSDSVEHYNATGIYLIFRQE